MPKFSDSSDETQIAHGGQVGEPQSGPLVDPIHMSAMYSFNDVERPPYYRYSRFNNPNRETLQQAICDLEGGEAAFVTCSGMAAIHSVLMLLGQGDHIVLNRQIFGGIYKLVNEVLVRFGVESTSIDMTNLEDLKAAIQPNTKIVWVETPTNPLLEVLDIQEIAKLAKDSDALTVVDNSFMTSFWQKPLEFGADIVVHSTSKYFNGHSDVIGGMIVAKTEAIADKLEKILMLNGVGAAPFESWLVTRGMRTLALRLKAHERAAAYVVEFLLKHDAVKNVYYPGLESHKGHEIAKKQQKSFGGVVSFEVDTEVVDVQEFLKNLEVFQLSYSLGGVESMISRPWSMSHGSLTEEERGQCGVTPGLLRISAGIEDQDDLIKDLQQALEHACKVVA